MYGDEDDDVPGYELDDLPAGYSPALSLKMARAHCWAPYAYVASALQGGLGENPGDREAARNILRGLFRHPAPFDAKVRFPQGQVFVSVDHGVFGQCVYQILTELLRVEAASFAGNPGQMVDACAAFMKAVTAAAGTLTGPEERGKPVLYSRALFEEAFTLFWWDKP
ncbi:hypothetical protein QOZ80_2BG0197590 [Eleusine coracana subsp. coracana]|nr:hypothetical protein QOZ80_2BG0197590 [Eleusine coracana subsp. coracana]